MWAPLKIYGLNRFLETQQVCASKRFLKKNAVYIAGFNRLTETRIKPEKTPDKTGKPENIGKIGQFLHCLSTAHNHHQYVLLFIVEYTQQRHLSSEMKYTPAVRSNILSKLIFANCV